MGVWSCCKGVNSRYLPLDKFANQLGSRCALSDKRLFAKIRVRVLRLGTGVLPILDGGGVFRGPGNSEYCSQ